MAKNNTSTKTIIVISASVLVASGLGFLIWKLVKNNKKKKEEAKRKKEEEVALNMMQSSMNTVLDGIDNLKDTTTIKSDRIIVDEKQRPSNNSISSAPSKTLVNIANKNTPTFNKKPKTFDVYKPLMK
jgi:hypothetical protein